MRKLSLLLVLMLLAVNIFALSEFDKHISNAKVYYDTGEFDKVINELSQALNIVKKNNQKGMVEAYKYLAFSYVAYDNVDKARNYFIEILKIDPEFDLDRDLTSPKILAVFDQSRVEYKKLVKEEKKKNAMEKAKTSTTKKNDYYVTAKKETKKKSKKEKSNKGKGELAKNTNPAKNTYIPPKTTPRQGRGNYKQPTKFNAMWRSFILPGWGQLYKKQTAKGWIFIGSTVVLDTLYILNTVAVKKAENNYETNKSISSDEEKTFWNKYDKVYGRYQLFGLIHFLFWTYNMTDASFFGWKKINLSMDVSKKGTFMFTLKKEF